MVDFKKMNLHTLGHLTIVGLLLVVAVFAIIHVVSPFLVTIGLITSALTMTDTLLLLILIRLFTKN